MSVLSSSKTVLVLKDEGLQIFSAARAATKFVDLIPWETEDFEISVSHIISKKCKRKPVVILNDMVEQHYRKEKMPKVGALDKGAVLKRRLSLAFPNYNIRAALKLKEKKGNAVGASYLFAAIPSGDQVKKTIQAVDMSGASIQGLYLLPVESSEMVRALSAKLSKKRAHKAEWVTFVGQHQGGGLRQIVIRNGELALTRMTPIIDTDVEPDLWAKEVSVELLSTMSYLARLGFKETDGLDVIIIANDSAQTVLEQSVDVGADLEIMTASEAASFLGINLGQQKNLRYADALHAAYVAKKPKLKLPMQSSAIDGVTKPRQIAALLIAGLLVGCAYFGYDVFGKFNKQIETSDRLEIVQQQVESVRSDYRRVLSERKALGYDLLLVNNTVEVYEEVQQSKYDVGFVLEQVGLALGADLKLNKMEFSSYEIKDDKQPANAFSYQPPSVVADTSKEDTRKNSVLNLVISFSFSSTIDVTEGVNRMNALRDRLRERLEFYDVSIIKQVADLSYTGNFVAESPVESSDEDNAADAAQGSEEVYTAEIQIRGRKK